MIDPNRKKTGCPSPPCVSATSVASSLQSRRISSPQRRSAKASRAKKISQKLKGEKGSILDLITLYQDLQIGKSEIISREILSTSTSNETSETTSVTPSLEELRQLQLKQIYLQSKISSNPCAPTNANIETSETTVASSSSSVLTASSLKSNISKTHPPSKIKSDKDKGKNINSDEGNVPPRSNSISRNIAGVNKKRTKSSKSCSANIESKVADSMSMSELIDALGNGNVSPKTDLPRTLFGDGGYIVPSDDKADNEYDDEICFLLNKCCVEQPSSSHMSYIS